MALTRTSSRNRWQPLWGFTVPQIEPRFRSGQPIIQASVARKVSTLDPLPVGLWLTFKSENEGFRSQRSKKQTHMKHYTICVEESICGTVDVVAKDENEARHLALRSGHIDWSNTSSTKVTAVLNDDEDEDDE